jgi:hypothetical protein
MAEDDADSMQSRFDTTGELDLQAGLSPQTSARFDVDLAAGDAQGDAASLEQAFFRWESAQKVAVKGGVFNNPLGWEAEDAPDKYNITPGLLYLIWDDATALYGNNVAGVSVSGKVGQATLTGALLNDLYNEPETHSVMAAVNFAPVAGVDLEAGFVTQETGYETIVDLNATYTQGLYTVGGEIMLPSELVDMAIGVTGVLKFNDQTSGVIRFDNVSYDASGIDDTSSITFGLSYMLDKNLVVNGEVRMNESDIEDIDGDLISMELIATF